MCTQWDILSQGKINEVQPERVAEMNKTNKRISKISNIKQYGGRVYDT